MKQWVFGLTIFAIALLTGPFVYGQLEVQGPGLNEAAPISITVNPPNGTTQVLFVIENTNPDTITITPMALCEPDTVKVDLASLTLDIPAAEKRSIQISLADLEGGADVGDIVECLFVTDFQVVSFFVTLAEPQDTQIGLFKLDVNLIPEGTQTEAVKMRADIEPNLQLGFTLSGLTVRPDIGFGVTGLEFAILKLNGFLGAIEIEDEFVFAAAFDFKDAVLANRRVSFVKKRVRTKFDLFGVTIDNLAIFENTKFRHPFIDDAQAVDAIDNPAFRFGNLLTLSARTVSNLPLTFVWGLCADPSVPNIIKKRFFMGSACNTDIFNYTMARLNVGTLVIGDLTLSGQLDFRPHQPVRGSLSARTRLLGFLSLSANLRVVDTDIMLQTLSLSLSDSIAFVSLRFRNDFSISGTSTRVTIRLANNNSLSLAFNGNGEQITSASAALNLNSAIGRLSGSFQFSRITPDTLTLGNTTFSLSQNLDNIQINTSISFTHTGLNLIRVSTQFKF